MLRATVIKCLMQATSSVRVVHVRSVSDDEHFVVLYGVLRVVVRRGHLVWALREELPQGSAGRHVPFPRHGEWNSE